MCPFVEDDVHLQFYETSLVSDSFDHPKVTEYPWKEHRKSLKMGSLGKT